MGCLTAFFQTALGEIFCQELHSWLGEAQIDAAEVVQAPNVGGGDIIWNQAEIRQFLYGVYGIISFIFFLYCFLFKSFVLNLLYFTQSQSSVLN